MSYCVQCGVEGKPVQAVGWDEDKEHACLGHAVAAYDTVEQCPRSVKCTKPSGHRGMCNNGTTIQRSHKKKVIPLKRETTLDAAEVEQSFPNADAFVGDSGIRVSLGCGELMLMYKGDLFALLQSKDDLHFVQSLVRVIQCRGKMMHPFSSQVKDKMMGKMLTVQMDEGFVDDMLDCMDSDEKARVLSIAWSKGI